MEQIALGTSGRMTTRMGFGCSSLMGAIGRRASLRLLESAFEAGIRHFDVAPMYGYGEAEACLGEFLERHRAEVTVTTKYGIPPGKGSFWMSAARRVAGPVVKKLPGIKQKLAGAASAAAGPAAKATFSVDEARASLERSLAALRVDRIDVWLLHEVEADSLHGDDLLRFMEDRVQQGTIGTFGVGSSADKIGALVTRWPAYCPMLQYEWSVFDPVITDQKGFRIHHRALTGNFRHLHDALLNDKDTCQRWSQATNTDLARAEELAHLMFRASLVMNPGAVILFSSKKPEHIRANVEAASDPGLETPARRLHELVQEEKDRFPPFR